MLTLQNGFYSLDLESEVLTPVIDPEQDLPGNRFNDGKCDPVGRFWAGTMSLDGLVRSGDPPADFGTTESYIVVNLNDACKAQQVGEDWFPYVNDVPNQAVSMSVHEIMNCKKIISSVPHKVKAQAIRQTLENELTPNIPATILKTHPDWTLVLERESAALVT